MKENITFIDESGKELNIEVLDNDIQKAIEKKKKEDLLQYEDIEDDVHIDKQLENK